MPFAAWTSRAKIEWQNHENTSFLCKGKKAQKVQIHTRMEISSSVGAFTILFNTQRR